MFRQGDVLLIPCKAKDVPKKGYKEVDLESGRLILAHGEATGHAHALEGEATLLARDVDEMRERFLKVEAESALVHEEHDTITIPKGTYRVRRQKEYEPRIIDGERRAAARRVYD